MADESVENTGIDALENFERALSHVRKSVQPLTLKSRDEVSACISPADRAKLDLQVAYGMSSLFYMFLRTQGVSPANHPVKTELDRIRDYFKRLKQVGKPPEQRTMKVDVAATRRFIDGALASDRVWQSAKSTDSKEAKRRRAEAGIGRSLPAGQPENPPALPEWVGRDTAATSSSGGKRKHETPAVSSSRDAAPREGGGSRARVEKGADVEQLEGAAAVATAAAEESPRVVKKVKDSGKKWDKNGKKRHR